MDSIEASVVRAMDGSDEELFDHLPYIMQDLWEIGSDPQIILRLIQKHSPREFHKLHILDLGCGKGAVSIRLAGILGCRCHGIDAVGVFIREARMRAAENHVDRLCRFETGDIRSRIHELDPYDFIILGSIGPVLGSHYETLSLLRNHLKDRGLIVLDDGYVEDASDFTHPFAEKRSCLLKQISLAGMRLIDEMIISPGDIRSSDEEIFGHIEKRCLELMEKFPAKKQLFSNYIETQKAENIVLEEKIICSTMLIGRL